MCQAAFGSSSRYLSCTVCRPSLQYVCPSTDIRGSALSQSRYDYYPGEFLCTFSNGDNYHDREFQDCYYHNSDGQTAFALNFQSTVGPSASTATAVLNCRNPAPQGYRTRKRSVETPPAKPKISREDLSAGMINMRDALSASHGVSEYMTEISARRF